MFYNEEKYIIKCFKEINIEFSEIFDLDVSGFDTGNVESMFAMFMGIARMLYGKFSERLDLAKVMLACAVMCACCYLLASLSSLPILGLAGCALCGLSVGIMWPGSISVSSQSCPKGGTAMFAFLALAGDLGAAAGPTVVGSISEIAGGDLKAGLLASTVFPVVLVIGLTVLRLTKRTLSNR